MTSYKIFVHLLKANILFLINDIINVSPIKKKHRYEQKISDIYFIGIHLPLSKKYSLIFGLNQCFFFKLDLKYFPIFSMTDF